jgi:hypothetical protein
LKKSAVSEQGASLYQYGGNTPLRLTDPTGLQDEDEFVREARTARGWQAQGAKKVFEEAAPYAEAAASLNPAISTVEAVTGESSIKGEKLSLGERALSLPGIGTVAKFLGLVLPAAAIGAIAKFGSKGDEAISLIKLAERAGVREIIEQGRLSVVLHGTTKEFAEQLVNTQGEVLSREAGKFGGKFFTALDPKVAEEFAARRVSNVGGSEAVVGIALPEEVMTRLKDLGLARTEKIPDRAGLQTIFEPEALDILKQEGFFFVIE